MYILDNATPLSPFLLPSTLVYPKDLEREVLRDEVAVTEDDKQVDLELDLELPVDHGGAAKQTRKDHVHGHY